MATGVGATVSRALTCTTIGSTVCTTIGAAVVATGVGATIGRTFTRAAVGAAVRTTIAAARTTIGSAVGTAVVATGVRAAIGRTLVGAARHTCRATVRRPDAALVVACLIQGGFSHQWFSLFVARRRVTPLTPSYALQRVRATRGRTFAQVRAYPTGSSEPTNLTGRRRCQRRWLVVCAAW